MKKNLIIASLVVGVMLVGLGFASAQEVSTSQRNFIQKDSTPMMRMARGEKMSSEEIYNKFSEEMTEIRNMTDEEFQKFLQEKKQHIEERKEHMGKKGRHMGKMGNGEMLNRMLEDEELMKEFAEKKGITVEELRKWIESCPFLEKDQ